jgi:peptidoglycan/xylan/chitin deacetylase (PgdA/CDA1 family)
VFVSLHDIDTGGFLRRRENDPLFRLEQKHEIKAVWFVPTGLLKGNNEAIDFLIQSGNEVGWHGHKHDHRLPYRPFADQRVTVLRKSILAAKEKYPLGMRTPKLLKSNYLFEVLDRTCPALCYDTSFLHGIVPYHLWLNGRRSSILEIPTTIPTDIAIYNQLRGVPRSRKPEIILQAQIARTEKIIEAGGVISIVTHPEKHLTERPDFLEVYDQYLAYIKGRSDIWFTTAGELFKYWTHEGPLKEL